MLSLRAALRLSEIPRVAFVGAGGKTTAMFSLAHQLEPPVITTATTHIGSWQLQLADIVQIVDQSQPFEFPHGLEADQGVFLFIGPAGVHDRQAGLSGEMVERLRAFVDRLTIPLLIEADGSRMRPLKAPGKHEPPIPDFADHVVVVAGMRAVGEPLYEETVHRSEIFSHLSGLKLGDKITPDSVSNVLCHTSGGMKNIPLNARRTLLLNQADSAAQRKSAQEIAQSALSCYDRVIVASLLAEKSISESKNTVSLNLPDNNQIYSVHEHIAGIILAAGESRRFGRPKQLLDWDGEPLIRRLAKTAVASGLSHVIIVTGANAEEILPLLEDLPVTSIYNSEWLEGQSSSIRAGIQALRGRDNAAIFILADQPYTSVELIQALVATHNLTMADIIAPVVNGQRGNPVLFDRSTFPDLLTLKGNEGGRAIFEHYSPQYISWHDTGILSDIDTPEDYRRLKDQKSDLV